VHYIGNTIGGEGALEREEWLPPSDLTGRKKWNLAMARLSLSF
jgi:hypothetical protein